VAASVAVNSAGTIQVIWYDRRDGPANMSIAVYGTTSNDGGKSFSANLSITGIAFSPAVGYDPVLNPTYMGDYIDIKPGLTNAGLTATFNMAWGDFRRVVMTPQGTRHDQDVFFRSN
jgi:hypothetical protein